MKTYIVRIITFTVLLSTLSTVAMAITTPTPNQPATPLTVSFVTLGQPLYNIKLALDNTGNVTNDYARFLQTARTIVRYLNALYNGTEKTAQDVVVENNVNHVIAQALGDASSPEAKLYFPFKNAVTDIFNVSQSGLGAPVKVSKLNGFAGTQGLLAPINAFAKQTGISSRPLTVVQ